MFQRANSAASVVAVVDVVAVIAVAVVVVDIVARGSLLDSFMRRVRCVAQVCTIPCNAQSSASYAASGLVKKQ